jgi:hypothetical protein
MVSDLSSFTLQFAVDGGDCSARNFAQVARAFYYAQKAVLYPVEPLYNGKKRVRWLLWIP